MRPVLSGFILLLLLTIMTGCARAPESAATPTQEASTASSGSSTPDQSPETTRSPQPETDPTDPIPSFDVGVTITWITSDASSATLSASIPGVIEDGGHCLATAVQGSSTKFMTSPAFADAQSTMCEPMTITDLTQGEWTIHVTYTSEHHSLTSDPTQVNIP